MERKVRGALEGEASAVARLLAGEGSAEDVAAADAALQEALNGRA